MLEPILPLLKRSLNGLGLEVSRRRHPVYSELLDAERYVERVVDLMGREFHIADSVSFFWNYQDIFVKDIYRFVTSRQTPYILDCGANSGLSVVYFKTLFPESEIVALEPDPKVFRLLERNVKVRGLDRVTLMEKAVAGSSGRVAFFREGADGGPLPSAEQRHRTGRRRDDRAGCAHRPADRFPENGHRRRRK